MTAARWHALTVVLACVAVLAGCGSQPRKIEPPPEPPAVPARPPDLPGGISFAAVGDIMMGTDYPENILPDDDGVGFLAGVAPVLSAADVAFGNLEGVLMDGGQAVKRCRPASKPMSGSGAADSGDGLAPVEVSVERMGEAGDGDGDATEKPSESPDSPTDGTRGPEAPPGENAAAIGDTTSAPTPRAASTEPSAPSPAAPTASSTLPAPSPPTTAARGATPPSRPATEGPRQSGNDSAGSAPAQAGATSGSSSASGSSSGAANNPVASDTGASPVQQPVTAGSCYVFRSPTRYATYLRDAGIDVVSLANNHAQDFGDPGRDSSMRALDDVGIHHSGREGDVAEWTTHGRRMALVAFAPNVGSHQLNDLDGARKIVTALAAHHDIVIVSFHGGGEGEGASTLPFSHEIYQGEDRGDVVEFAHAVIDAGADLVIGHGPHVLRPIELYRDRLVAYSLGNFATYFGISVNGIRGQSGILTTRLAADGRFLEARLDSTIQLRPAGPTLDPERRALTRLRALTTQAFPAGALRIEDDGRILRQQ